MKLSICIVNYNAKNYLKHCLESIYKNPPSDNFEIVLVDNASRDSSQEMVEKKFGKVKLIKNSANLGFTKANNQAMKAASSEYILVLNNDTIILNDALDTLIKFMDTNPKVGACGPKTLNSDKTIQSQCKRGLPTPWNMISYLLKLDKLFPKSKLFGGYLLTYLDPNQPQEVGSLSGSCMLVRQKTIKEVGYMDEGYFMYGDDIDWCYRIKKSGWQIFYVPTSSIIHFGGKGGAGTRLFRNIFEFNRSAYLFHKKHLAKQYFFLINWLVYLGILIKFLTSLIVNLLRSEKAVGSRKP